MVAGFSNLKSLIKEEAQAASLEPGLLVASRFCLLGIALLTTSLCAVYSISPTSLFAAVALLLSFCATSTIWIIWKKTDPIFCFTQFLSDVFLITCLIYVTGGPISPFIFLYLALVMAAAVVYSRLAALTIALTCLVFYSLLAWSLIQGWLSPFNGEVAVHTPARGVIFQVIGLGSAMILVAVAVNYLRKKILVSQKAVEESKKDLVTLTAKQQVLIEGIPDGVIITDLNESIASLNQTSLDLLNITEEEALGKKVVDLLEDVFPESEKQELYVGKGTDQYELDIKDPDTKESRKILYSRRPIIEPSGEQSGTLYLFENVTKLRSIERQLDLQERMARLLASKDDFQGPSHPSLPEFVGESPVMQKVFRLIERVAPSDASVLISGESGTGKELVARAIHLSGERAERPFVAINCGAVPENLIESQLFGHKKGSFTGAHADQIGLFQEAEDGTIFLDEVGELPLHLQAKLLRAIQEKTIRPIGGDRDIQVHARIVSATNRKLKAEVQKKTFREDLYYRLNVIAINLPPLRDRKEDIPLLVNSILRRIVGNEVEPVVPPATMKILMDYDYQGNVRELENILERAMVLGGEVILPEHLPESITNRLEDTTVLSRTETLIIVNEDLEFPVKLDDLLKDMERQYLEEALAKADGIKKRAAEMLGINFRSFRYRLQKFGIGDESSK